MNWVELIDRIARISGVHRPILVLPLEAAAVARASQAARIPSPIAPEGVMLMAENWRASSRKARRELGYRTRSVDGTLRATIEWYGELIDRGVFAGRRASGMSVASAGMRAAERFGLGAGLRELERLSGRRLVAGL
jgi:hypothetical protein